MSEVSHVQWFPGHMAKNAPYNGVKSKACGRSGGNN